MLSTVVSGISRETPYGVPAGYFDGFPSLMLSLTGDPGAEGPFFATNKGKQLTFSVPEGYFEGFAQGLLDKIKAVGASQGGEAKQELARLSPLLNGISRETPYEVPEGYFEELSPIMAPLAEVREKPLYIVPEGYFAGLASDILSKVPDSKESQEPESREPARVISAPVISLNRRSLGQHSWWKYAAAAVVAGLIFTIGWLRLHTSTGNGRLPVADIAGNLVKASDQDLQNYLDDQNDQSFTQTEPVNSTATLDITDSDVKSLLGDVPDGELKSYMEEHGGANDIATN